MKANLLSILLIALVAGVAGASIDVQSDGSDGALVITSSTQIDLSLAPTSIWTDPSTGVGVYDSTKWAVVFKYSSVDIGPGATVTFKNHPSRAPVVWLVSGSVTIEGTIDLSGESGTSAFARGQSAEPGPGGFRGGRRDPYIDGFGPGGGRYVGQGGTYASPGVDNPLPAYGNPQIVPLIGGSGGGAGYPGSFGGAGGGAILIAAADSLRVPSGGVIRAKGGVEKGNGGSGAAGAIRLVAKTVRGGGTLDATALAGARDGGYGRIRVEAGFTDWGLVGFSSPTPSIAAPDIPPKLWPEPTDPRARVVSFGGDLVPIDPKASFAFPLTDLSVSTDVPIDIVIETENVPTDWIVAMRFYGFADYPIVQAATHTSGTASLSTWTISQFQVTDGFAAAIVTARAP